MTLVIPANVAPGSPLTWEMYQQLTESQSADAATQALDATLAQVYPASGLTAHGAAISNATTNTAMVTVPAANVLASAVAGSIFYLRAYGIVSAPASAGATLAFNGYSGGSGGTALATMTAFTPTASLAAALFDVEMWVNFYSATTAQALVKAVISSSTSTAAASTFLAGNNSATPVTVTAGTSLTLNAVMGSAVSGSSYEALAAYWNQVA
jgi:hypothetical protein